jgi:curved DNA-binding protein CbpA
MENPYTVLGVNKNASSEEVKKAYFGLIRKHSPEKDSEGFKRIRLAYESLRDLDKRSKTDIFMFNDPYGEFIIVAPGEYKIEKEIDLESAIYSLSDLGRIDFSNDFSDIED